MRALFYIFIISLGITLASIILVPSLFDIKSYKKKIENIVYEKTGNTLKIEGDINLDLFPRPVLKVQGIKYYKTKKDLLFNSEELIIVPEILSFIKGNIVFSSIQLLKPSIFIKAYSDNSNNWNDAFNKTINSKDTTYLKKKEESVNIKNNTKSNLINIKSLKMKDAKFLYINKDESYVFKNIQLSLESLKENKYTVNGYFNYNEERIKFSYNLLYNKPSLHAKGFINNSIINFSNETKLNLVSLIGKSKVTLTVDNVLNLKKLQYLGSFPIEIQSDFDFSKQSIKFNKIEILSENTNLKGQGTYKENQNEKSIIIKMKSNEINLNNYLLNKVIVNKNNSYSNKNKSASQKKIKNNYKTDIFKLLEGYNISVKVKADSIKYNKFEAKDIDFLFLKRDAINLAIVIQKLFNGKTEVDLEIKENKTTNFVFDAHNIALDQVNILTGHNYISGKLDLYGNVSGSLKNKSSFLKSLSGDILVKNKNTYINNINLAVLRKNILNIKDISSVTKVKNGVFEGKTKIQNSKNTFTVNKGILKLESARLKLDEAYIKLDGDYNIIYDKVNIMLNLDDKNNELLKLFNINFTGNLNNISTKLNNDNKKTEKLLDTIFKKEIKKMIKKNLDKSFNNIIEKLLD